MEPIYRDVPAWIVERYPDVGIYTFKEAGYEAPLLTTQDPAAFKPGRFVVYRLGIAGVAEDFSAGVLLDMRAGLYVLDDITGRGLCEVSRRDVLGVSVGVITNHGVVMDGME